MPSILIIGASSGIGAAVALRLASRFAAASQDCSQGRLPQGGLDLILHGRNEERLEAVRSQVAGHKSQEGKPETTSKSNGLRPTTCDLLIGDVVAWAEDPKGIPEIEPVDAVVWSAGICELAAGQMLSLKALRRTLSVNLEAPLVVLSHFYRKGIIKNGGTIVLLGSESAHDAGEGFSVYAASKGGLASAARVLGKEFARKNIGVHCIEPGTVNTPMTQNIMKLFGGLPFGKLRAGKDGHMERMVEPEDVGREIVERIFPHGATKAPKRGVE